jgi:hypothetical protein
MTGMDPVRCLIINATLQFFVSSLLGVLLLIPMQTWGKEFFSRVSSIHDIRATHLDWLMLGLMQYGVAFGLSRIPLPNGGLISGLLIFGGWMNAFPYFARGMWGINAFQLAGPPKQFLCALISLISVLSLLTSFGFLLAGWLFR